jgi:LmbE family N-acetylglucosaminyl deacetylase
MDESLKLMFIAAHPDDEALGMGFTLAKYAAEGVEVTLVCATRGERGWTGPENENPGMQAIGQIREAELRASVRTLGIKNLFLLDYIDGELDQADPQEAAAKIAIFLRRLRPQVAVTFDPFGSYGHPDHIAISQFTQAAVVLAAQPGKLDGNLPPYSLPKLYYMIDSLALVKMYGELMGETLSMDVNGERRLHTGWPAWAASARIDATAYWETGLQAMACHQSQVADFWDRLTEIPRLYGKEVWAVQPYYRAFSLVNGGPAVEDDLFAGLR